ncbi:hypothetical protein CEXT_27981 [Caerostris extrusa]|uniref:Uncharacterized protein n=1 Tax=Caerostris extrusa TaxID=172846 RepID=A0AAV4TYB3_CAEEX|nr:hypothetical protein CEXT_27981 [Caerostris extrusa]
MDSVQHRASKIIIEQSPLSITTRPNRNVAYLLLKTDATLPPLNLLPEYLKNGRAQPDSKDPQLYHLIKISEYKINTFTLPERQSPPIVVTCRCSARNYISFNKRRYGCRRSHLSLRKAEIRLCFQCVLQLRHSKAIKKGGVKIEGFFSPARGGLFSHSEREGRRVRPLNYTRNKGHEVCNRLRLVSTFSSTGNPSPLHLSCVGVLIILDIL